MTEKASVPVGASVHATIMSRAPWYVLITPKEGGKGDYNVLVGRINMDKAKVRRMVAMMLRDIARGLDG